MLSRKWLVSLSVAASLSVLTACGGSTDGGSEAKPSTSQEAPAPSGEASSPEVPAAPEPDVKDVPDVVAQVNGEEISKKEFVQVYQAQFQQLAMQSQMSGQELDQGKLKKQVAESMVGTELMLQEAQKRKIDVSDAEVDKKLDELMTQNNFKSRDELMAALQKQGLDKAAVQAQLKSQITLEKLIADESGDPKPTEKELKAAYEEVKGQQSASGDKGAEVPPYEDVKVELEKQLKTQKQSEAAQALVGELRKDADVKVNI